MAEETSPTVLATAVAEEAPSPAPAPAGAPVVVADLQRKIGELQEEIDALKQQQAKAPHSRQVAAYKVVTAGGFLPDQSHIANNLLPIPAPGLELSSNQLERQVAEMVAQGWTPLGGPSLTAASEICEGSSYGGLACWTQGMVLYGS